jgi:uncharacterized protein (UPF0548 family)
VLRLFRASEDLKKNLLASARDAAPSSPHLMTLTEGSLGVPPKGFAHDFARIEIGKGRRVFAVAREAFLRWEQFDLGWVHVLNPIAKIAPGELISVEAHTGCFWSVNFNRIVDVVDSTTRFGFLYTTTGYHVEEGQERFTIDFDPDSESVCYLIEAVSRPRHVLARIARPYSRAMQHRFSRDSRARILRCVRAFSS